MSEATTAHPFYRRRRFWLALVACVCLAAFALRPAEDPAAVDESIGVVRVGTLQNGDTIFVIYADGSVRLVGRRPPLWRRIWDAGRKATGW